MKAVVRDGKIIIGTYYENAKGSNAIDIKDWKWIY
jgi:hypothetical protein